MPTVSVIIPTYNRAEVLPRAIKSVLAQTYDDLELIIVDDASTDDTAAIVEQFDDNRVQYYCLDKNSGANVARNLGIDNAKGDYIAFLDSDDEWKQSKLERQMQQLLSSEEYGASYTAVAQLNVDGQLNAISRASAHGDISKHLLRGNIVGTFSSVIVSKKVIEIAGKPDPKLPCWQDWEWYFRLSDNTNFSAISTPLTLRYSEGDQISRSFEPKLVEAYPVIKDKITKQSSSQQEQQIGYAYLNYELGYSALVSTKYSVARTKFLQAIKQYPYEPKFYKYLLFSGYHYVGARIMKRKIVRLVSK